MRKYSQKTVSDVLAANDIVSVIGGFLELKPAGGARFKALCPFHNEKTPSFTVSRDRQFFKCFGCGKFGDAVDFLCAYEGLSFVEALRKLAERGGVSMPALTEQDSREEYLRTQLIEFGKFASAFFVGNLNGANGSGARQYLKTRGLKPETVERFGLGYAPDSWTALVDKATASRFRDTVLEASGLARRGERGRLYDFFRNRLMVPIRDVPGYVVAFGGRDLGDGVPKYINSPETGLYRKSRVLYGLYEARDAMRQAQRVVLVEGYFDLLRCVDAGIENVVATCGTALTPEQAGLIRRYVRDIVVVFDADVAGIRAALRGVGLLANAGLTVRAMTLPAGKDPDDFIGSHGADAFRALVDNAEDFVTFYINRSRERLETIEGRSEVARKLFAILATLQDTLQREEYLERMAEQLRLNVWTCREEFRRFRRGQSAPGPQRAEPGAPETAPVNQDDCDFVAALLRNEVLLRKVQKMLQDVPLLPGPVPEVLAALFEGTGLDVVERIASEDGRNLYAVAATNPELPPDKAVEIAEKRTGRLKRDSLVAEQERLQQELQQAEQAQDQERVLALLSRKVEVTRRIEEIGAL